MVLEIYYFEDRSNLTFFLSSQLPIVQNLLNLVSRLNFTVKDKLLSTSYC